MHVRASPQVSHRPPGTILVVDDDENLRELMVAILEGEGHTVVQAADGRDALRYLRAGARPLLVVLDLTMPVMDGWQFHREMRADPNLAAIPVVVVSGWHDGEAAVPVPANRFLRKPFDAEDLLALVARYGR